MSSRIEVERHVTRPEYQAEVVRPLLAKCITAISDFRDAGGYEALADDDLEKVIRGAAGLARTFNRLPKKIA